MRGIEWIKMNINMYEDEIMRLIDSMEERDTIFYVWTRLLFQAGRVNDNGLIYLKKNIPYTAEMLSTLFKRPVEKISMVLEVLQGFNLIQIYENDIIVICNWEKHQNTEGMKKVREGTKNRVRDFRERKKKENETLNNSENNTEENRENEIRESTVTNTNKNCNAFVTLQREKGEEEKENKNKDIEERKERDKECSKIINDLKKTNVSIKGLTLKEVREMLSSHKKEYIKMAIGLAIERDKLDINYIKGILKNWLKEGYPKNYGEAEFENLPRENLKEKPNLRFINFEARKYDYDELEKKLLGW